MIDMGKKVAEQLVDTLIEAGVRRIYAVTGDSLNEVNEAVRQNEAMKWIHVRHEETGCVCRRCGSTTDRTAGMLCRKQRSGTWSI